MNQVQVTPESHKTTKSENAQYEATRANIAGSINAAFKLAEGRIFRTSVTDLFMTFLGHLPVERRPHYNCRACKNFFDSFCTLVTIEGGKIKPMAFDLDLDYGMFQDAIDACYKEVASSNIIGMVFIPSKVWGKPQTGKWSHFSASGNLQNHTSLIKSAFQAEAEKAEEFRMVNEALSDFPVALIQKAEGLLKVWTSGRKKTFDGIMTWFKNLAESTRGARNRSVLVWEAVSKAPVGFAHIRSSAVGGILADLKNGYEPDVCKARWLAKLNPLKYQRPESTTDGNIEQAEKIIESLGLAPSLERRFARMEDLRPYWVPVEKIAKHKIGGVFGHLRSSASSEEVTEASGEVLTWEKFRRIVLPDVVSVEIAVPQHGNFISWVTAAHSDAPKILRWDNPVSWYVYSGGAPAFRFNLAAGWGKVSAICYCPDVWGHEEERVSAFAPHLGFVIENCREPKGSKQLGLFPNILLSELHPIRATIEAYSNSKGLEPDSFAVAGLLMGGSRWNQKIRVVTRSGIKVEYTLDRWD